MKGNLMDMWAVAEAWLETLIVQQPVAQLTESHRHEPALVQAPVAPKARQLPAMMHPPDAPIASYCHPQILSQ